MKVLITTVVLLFSTTAFTLPRENTNWNGINITKSSSPENTCDFSIESVVATDGKNYKRIRQGHFQITVNGMVFNETLDHAKFDGYLVIDRSAGKLVYKGYFSYFLPQSKLNGTPALINIETEGRKIIHMSIERQIESDEMVFSNGCGSMKVSNSLQKSDESHSL